MLPGPLSSPLQSVNQWFITCYLGLCLLHCNQSIAVGVEVDIHATKHNTLSVQTLTCSCNIYACIHTYIIHPETHSVPQNTKHIFTLTLLCTPMTVFIVCVLAFTRAYTQTHTVWAKTHQTHINADTILVQAFTHTYIHPDTECAKTHQIHIHTDTTVYTHVFTVCVHAFTHVYIQTLSLSLTHTHNESTDIHAHTHTNTPGSLWRLATSS